GSGPKRLHDLALERAQETAALSVCWHGSSFLLRQRRTQAQSRPIIAQPPRSAREQWLLPVVVRQHDLDRALVAEARRRLQRAAEPVGGKGHLHFPHLAFAPPTH